MGKSRTQTTTQALDPASQQYVEQMRRQAQGASATATGGGPFFTGPQSMSVGDQAAQFFNPYQQNVIQGVQGEYDHLRDQAGMGVDQQATMSGAFGGSRHGVALGARMGELDRAEASQIGDLMNSGYQNALGMGMNYSEHQRQLQEQQMQEPLWRQQQAMGFWGQGMGPTGGTSTTSTPGNLIGDLVGTGLTLGGAGVFGGLGGLFGSRAAPTGSANVGMGYNPGMSGFRL